MTDTKEDVPLYLPMSRDERELCIIDVEGPGTNFAKYFTEAFRNKAVIRNMSPEMRRKARKDPSKLSLEIYQQLERSLDMCGYSFFYSDRDKGGRWLVHKTPEPNRYRFILVGDEWRYDIVERVAKFKDVMKTILRDYMGFKIIE